MANDTKVLREYLLSLGFKVDAQGARKFDGVVEGFDKSIKGLGISLLAATGALVGLVNSAANSMEKLYYSSRRAGTTVGTLQAMRYGAGQIGLDAEALTGIIDNFGMALRRNPGLVGLLKQLGVSRSGDNGKDFTSLIEKLSTMPFQVAAGFAENFGIDEKTLFMLEDSLPKYKAAMELARQMRREAGVDSDEAAKSMVEYNNQLSRLAERLSVVRDAVAVKLLPAFKEMSAWLDSSLTKLAKVIGDKTVAAPDKPFFPRGGTKAPRGLFDDVRKWWNELDQNSRAASPRAGGFVGPPETLRGSAKGGGGGRSAMGGDEYSHWEYIMGLRPGELRRMAMQESSMNPSAVSYRNGKPVARGLMQLIPSTAQHYDVDPFDPHSAIRGGAEYMADLLRQFGGSYPLAHAAYNAGPGNIRKWQLGQYDLKPETVNYVKRLDGVTLEPHTTIIVNGAGDPAAVAKNVAAEQARVPGEIIRTMKGVTP